MVCEKEEAREEMRENPSAQAQSLAQRRARRFPTHLVWRSVDESVESSRRIGVDRRVVLLEGRGCRRRKNKGRMENEALDSQLLL